VALMVPTVGSVATAVAISVDVGLSILEW